MHTNVYQALIELGYKVDISSNSDGFKNIGDSTIRFLFKPSNSKLLRAYRKLVFPFKNLKSYYGYDIVQLIDHNIFGGAKFGYNHFILKRIKKKSEKMFLLSIGSSFYYYQLIDKLRYHPLKEHIKIDGISEKIFNKYSNRRNNQKVVQLVDKIIPSTYSYRLAYNDFHNLDSTIPFPLNLKTIKSVEQSFNNDKITVLHGLLREGFKGSKYIIPAMERLKTNYPDRVEIIIDGKMPLEKYKKILAQTNILVDQALSYEYGMNALYAMSMGKVVLSGNEPESRMDMGRDDIPVINILPDENDIYLKLEELILNKEKIIEVGQKSRKYVEEVHDSIVVAKKYLAAWGIRHE